MTLDKLDDVRKGLFDNDRAVSPVIGVILMVAITVILAAVIGTFVLGLGQDVGQAAPQASLSVSASASANTTTIEHTGGDGLHSDRTKITIEHNGAEIYSGDATDTDGVLTVGGSEEFTFGGTPAAPGGSWSNYDAPTSTANLQSGDTIFVQLIDTETQRIIFETEITV